MNIAYASVTIPDSFTLDMGLIGEITMSILIALATVWVLRKCIKQLNRS